MSIGLTPALQSSQRCLQAFAAKAPEALLPILRSPIFYKSVALLFGVRIFSIVTRWIRQRPWKAEGELAIITGGSSGIGRQIVQDLVKLRVKVVILDTKEPQSDLSSGVFFYKVDITSSKHVNDVAQRIATEHGYPTILINNAGVAVEGTILDKDEKDIRLTMEVNTLSHFWTVKAFLPSMVEKNHGHIITIASIASFVSMGEAVDYGCSKAAALAFHEGLTQEVKHWYKANNVRTRYI
ncbi:hypothetical protein Plec18167_001472 [Paecilomyces lecythidis]|uniref:Uncharacterized protein n=1 Tax=Paecilomyces lecythidis TaxID=3004212 RepID=A0ABR3YDC7_9EURO